MWATFLDSFLSLLALSSLMTMLGAVLLGLFFGALPGLNATMAVVIMLPLTYMMEPAIGLATLIGAYIGGISGGLVSAVLMRIPGTPSSVGTTFDAFPLARQGQAVKALGTGIVASFVGGILSLAVLMTFAPFIARYALKFGPFEYTALTILALTLVGTLSSGNMIKGVLAACIGIAISLIGFAPLDGMTRFTMGSRDLIAGIGLIPFMIGLFAIPQIFREIQQPDTKLNIDLNARGLGVTVKEIRDNAVNLLRSTGIGVGVGVLPGVGGATSNLLAYAAAKRLSKKPEKFGKGSLEGIYAAESANNASVGGALLPLMTLGIPGDAVTAVLIGGFTIHGLQPGPLLFRDNPEVITGIYAAFLIAAVMVLATQFLTLRIFPRVLLTPRRFLLPVLIMLAVIGAFVSDNRIFDISAMLAVGAIGIWLESNDFPIGPVVLGFVLGPILELNLRRALIHSDGSLLPFVTQPIALCLVVTTVAVLALNAVLTLRARNTAPTTQTEES